MRNAAVYMLAVLLAVLNGGCVLQPQLDPHFYLLPGAGRDPIPLKVALILPPDPPEWPDPERGWWFLDLQRNRFFWADFGRATVGLQPALAAATKATLEQDFRTVTVTGTAARADHADLAVYPSVVATAAGHEYVSVQATLKLEFRDARTGSAIDHLEHTAVASDDASWWDVSLTGLGLLSLGTLAPVMVPVGVEHDASAFQGLTGQALSEDLDALSEQIRNSPAILAMANGRP